MTDHNKLVRNKIPEICEADGATPNTKVITNKLELLRLLGAKLTEETTELIEKPILDEFADVAQVLYDTQIVLEQITEEQGLTPAQIEDARLKKAAERGGFDEGIYLISTDRE